MSAPRAVHAAFLALLFALPVSAQEGAPPRREADRPRERAEWNLILRRDAQGRVRPENRLEALQQACELPVDPSMAQDPAGGQARSRSGPSVSSLLTFGGTAWQAIGPAPINPLPNDMYRWTSASGRISALAAQPGNSNVLLLGSATGGIWKSTNAGTSWRPVSDTAPSLAISSLAFSRSNPSIVFAATGEVDDASMEFRPSFSLGLYLSAGLLRSVDAGETWTRVDTNLPAGALLSRVLVHPANPQLVLVGVYLRQDTAGDGRAPGGIYRSTDGGVTFAPTFTHYASDLVQDPVNADTVLAGFGVTGGCSSCEEDGVWGSTNFGQTWSPVLTAGSTMLGNVKIAVSQTNPPVYVASVLDTHSSHSGIGGIYRSTDGGGHWDKMAVNSGMCPADGLNQCDYDHFVAVHPTNPSTLYFGSINVYRSDDGAATWRKLTPFYDGNYGATIHPDQHAALFLPGSPDTLLVGCDGGLYRTTDGGGSWTSLNGSLCLAQFNSLSLHPSNPSVAIGGTQDNGTPMYGGNATWNDRTAGDGGNPLIRQDDPSKVFAPRYYSGFTASTDGGATFHDVDPCGTLENCDTRDPLEEMAFYAATAAAPGAPGTLLVGTNRIWANTTFGTNASAWVPRSAAKIAPSGFFTSIDAAGDGSAVWAGSVGGSVYFSTDGGATFADRTGGLGPGTVSRVKAFSGDGRSAYVTKGGFSGAPSRHVFRTTDGGASWANVTGNLPDAPVLAIAVDPTDANDLFVGTDVGVFRSTNGGASWVSFNQGLPNVPVTDLKFGPTSSTLTAATYGRGAYRIVTQASNGPPTAAITSPASDVTVAVGQAVTFAATASDPDGDPMTYAWSFGDGATSSALSPGAHAYASAGAKSVTFRATDSHGASSAVQTRTITVQSAGGGGGASAVKFVPIVLDVGGAGSSRFSTELTLTNRGTTPASVSLLYTAASALGASGSGTVPTAIGAGRQLVVPDALAFLRSLGLAIPANGSGQGGTLRVTFTGLSSPDVAYAAARTTTPSGSGRAGLSYPGVSPDRLFTDKAWIYGLRQNGADRSNLALVNASTTSNVTLRTLLFNPDASRYYQLADTTLGPGQWTQISRVLDAPGFAAGFARVQLVSGSGPFYAYGVFNDNVTNDGSFAAPEPDTYYLETQTVPVLVETSTFSSELVLVNYASSTAAVALAYRESLNAAGGTGTVYESLGPGEQRIIPDAIQYLRSKGIPLSPKGTGSFAGSLAATFSAGGARDGGFAGARTGAPAAIGGQYGLFYSGTGPTFAAGGEAWVLGLQENASVRANLAVANLGENGSSLTFRVEVYDGDSGSKAGTSIDYTLPPGGWIQFGGVLPTFGVHNGYARVVRVGGTSRFVAYGVVNDGATPSSGATNDGSYIGFANQ